VNRTQLAAPVPERVTDSSVCRRSSVQPSNPQKKNPTMSLLASPALASVYVVGGSGLGLLIVIIIVVLLVRR
jgi:hypothetical protein